MTKPVAIVTRKWPKENEDRLKELFDVTLTESLELRENEKTSYTDLPTYLSCDKPLRHFSK